MRRMLITPPATEPLTLDEARHWLRVAENDDDALIAGLIRACRERIEGRTGRALVSQVWRVLMDAWPPCGQIRLPLMPVQSVVAVRVLDAGAQPAVLAGSLYRLEPGEEPPLLVVNAVPHPGRVRSGIEIDLIAGYGPTPQDVPESLRQALRLMLTDAYERRGPERASRTTPADLAPVEALLQPYRALHLASSCLSGAA